MIVKNTVIVCVLLLLSVCVYSSSAARNPRSRRNAAVHSPTASEQEILETLQKSGSESSGSMDCVPYVRLMKLTCLNVQDFYGKDKIKLKILADNKSQAPIIHELGQGESVELNKKIEAKARLVVDADELDEGYLSYSRSTTVARQSVHMVKPNLGKSYRQGVMKFGRYYTLSYQVQRCGDTKTGSESEDEQVKSTKKGGGSSGAIAKGATAAAKAITSRQTASNFASLLKTRYCTASGNNVFTDKLGFKYYMNKAQTVAKLDGDKYMLITPQATYYATTKDPDHPKETKRHSTIHYAYIKLATQHDHVMVRARSGDPKWHKAKLENGHLRVMLEVQNRNGKTAIMALTNPGEAEPNWVSVRSNWKTHPSTGDNVQAVYLKQVWVEATLTKGSVLPCLWPAQVCSLLQEHITPETERVHKYGELKTLHQRLVCTARFESGFMPSAVNDKNTDGSCDVGLFQTNSVHWKAEPKSSCHYKWREERCKKEMEALKDPEYTMPFVVRIFEKQGINAWYAYRDYCRPLNEWSKARYACPPVVPELNTPDDYLTKWDENTHF
jgi:C-type lysozyme/alpha-lactalbumin family